MTEMAGLSLEYGYYLLMVNLKLMMVVYSKAGNM